MSSIVERQNTETALTRLAAFRRLYTESKRVRAFRISVALVLAFIGLGATILQSQELQNGVALVSFILIIFGVVFKAIESTKVDQAAAIQEDFDTFVLDLEPNSTLAPRVTMEDVHAAAKRYGEDRTDLKDWYVLHNAADLPHEWQILLCQRCNLVWDSNLRRHYSWFVLAITLTVLVLSLLLGVYFDLKLIEFIVALGSVLPALLYGVEVYVEHYKVRQTKGRLHGLVMDVWKEALKRQQTPPVEMTRRIQNEIFHSRLIAVQVPDFFAKRHRKAFQEKASAAIEDLAQKARVALGLPSPTLKTSSSR